MGFPKILLINLLLQYTDTPANKILTYYIQIKNNVEIKKYRGKPRTTLITTILKDLNYLNLNLNNEEDLVKLKTIAKNKKTWELMEVRIKNKMRKNDKSQPCET